MPSNKLMDPVRALGARKPTATADRRAAETPTFVIAAPPADSEIPARIGVVMSQGRCTCGEREFLLRFDAESAAWVHERWLFPLEGATDRPGPEEAVEARNVTLAPHSGRC